MNRARQALAAATVAIIGCPVSVRCQDVPTWVHELGYGSAQLHRIRVGAHGFPFLDVAVDGQEIALAFDTGNTVGLSLARSLIERLGLSRVGAWTSVASDGRIVGRYGVFRADSVRLFDVTRRDESIYELADSDLSGLIGPRLLRGRRFTLDYQRGLLAISDSGLPASIAAVLPLVRSRRHPELLLVRGRVDGRDVLVEIDSGKSRSTIDPGLARELGLRIDRAGAAIAALTLGSFTFSVPSAKLVVLRDIDETLPQPILVGVGSDVLRQIVWTVDYIRGVVLLQREGLGLVGPAPHAAP